MLKLKFQYFGHLRRRTDSGKDLDRGKDWRQKEKGMTEDEMVRWHHWLNGHELSKLLELLVMDKEPGVLQSMGSQRVRHDWVTELNWTELCVCVCVYIYIYICMYVYIYIYNYTHGTRDREKSCLLVVLFPRSAEILKEWKHNNDWDHHNRKVKGWSLMSWSRPGSFSNQPESFSDWPLGCEAR